MARRLEDKVVIISGGAKGQGEAEVRLFVEEGARVVFGDVLDDVGREVAHSLDGAAIYHHLDVTKERDWDAIVKATLDRYGRVDVLVNNAGILRVRPLVGHSLEDYRDIIEVNQIGTFLGMRAVAPIMKDQRQGVIVNTSSTCGFIGSAGLMAYTASKFAVRGMTKVAAVELGQFGIRVNAIHPSAIDTDMLKAPGLIDPDKGTVVYALPINRLGKPIEVARLVAFLASDESSYCTGAEFLCDGGYLCGPPIPGG